ncbi:MULTISPECIES: DUF7331 family protein [Haloarcula]
MQVGRIGVCFHRWSEPPASGRIYDAENPLAWLQTDTALTLQEIA